MLNPRQRGGKGLRFRVQSSVLAGNLKGAIGDLPHPPVPDKWNVLGLLWSELVRGSPEPQT